MNIYNILLGTAIGDAFGAGVEFQDRDWIQKNVDFSEFVNVRHLIKTEKSKLKNFTENYKAWDYTDDTEMSIAVLKALISQEDFNEALLVKKWTEEYKQGIAKKGYGRNGHGSMRWYYSGEKTIEEIRSFQKDRPNPGNAPAMRAVFLGLIQPELINEYAKINATATHPNINAILSSECIARAAEFLIVKKGNRKDIIKYCFDTVDLNDEYKSYLQEIAVIDSFEKIVHKDYEVLCGPQPIERPYFLSGIKGVPSDSKFTTGCVLYLLKHCKSPFEALKKSVLIGGDVDSLASITTGILSGVYGISDIPQFMIDNVEGKEYFKLLADEAEPFLKTIR